MKLNEVAVMVALSFCFSSALGASTGAVQGTVHDIDTNAVVGSVTIEVEVPASPGAYPNKVVKTLTSAANGSFFVTGLEPGLYGLAFTKPGYRKNFDTVRICDDAALILDARLHQLRSEVEYDFIPTPSTYLSNGKTIHTCPKH